MHIKEIIRGKIWKKIRRNISIWKWPFISIFSPSRPPSLPPSLPLFFVWRLNFSRVSSRMEIGWMPPFHIESNQLDSNRPPSPRLWMKYTFSSGRSRQFTLSLAGLIQRSATQLWADIPSSSSGLGLDRIGWRVLMAPTSILLFHQMILRALSIPTRPWKATRDSIRNNNTHLEFQLWRRWASSTDQLEGSVWRINRMRNTTFCLQSRSIHRNSSVIDWHSTTLLMHHQSDSGG